ncbi:MAG: HEPN domain-containing protein [Pyrobaculum sp.]
MDESEYKRWIDMAERTLKSAFRDAEGGDYNWACFKAHQSAEFALKALLYGVGKPARGHSVTRLLKEVSALVEVGEELFELAALLDKFYVPTRYVDAWSEGVPYEYFTRRDAESAINAASKILEFVKKTWTRLSGGGV